ncbi:uncharacterized protein BJ171DRAFT_424476 [Polychytrium aggregatum]|uniref:uncharacterized protein n=1 Tax=Polychytrium aggregatum TaxID=110093 RepID=UPI0022FEC6FB|nr:uncharacterized protein BJ171DRAFT_424476 [Polychytrium aggregatum]KAI9204246.1 hypothetical protein BJ171DRAFT_424476 [Polychytrium aggregatum]
MAGTDAGAPIRRISLPDVNPERLEKKIKKAKLAARSELDIFEWQKMHLRNMDFGIDSSRDTVQRIDYSAVSEDDFVERFESQATPVVITGAVDDWAAKSEWTAEKLFNRYHSEKFKVGEDDDGDPVYMPLKYYLHYALNHDGVTDDSPLYIFDANFGERRRNNTGNQVPQKDWPKPTDSTGGDPSWAESTPTASLLSDYKIPKYFEDDLFRLTGRKRPPHRWVVWGPARSGTGIHVDPLGTSAWNALLVGSKRWALFPPQVDRKIIEPRGLPDHEAATWFACVYSQLAAESTRDENGQTLLDRLGVVEILQRPGETVFVPGGWWHVVINLDFALAVTQNYCSRGNLEYVWLKTRFTRPKLADRLYQRLKDSSSSDSGSTESESSDEEGNCRCRACQRKRRRPQDSGVSLSTKIEQ